MPRLAEIHAEGLISRKIAERLNEEGVKGIHGGRWHHRTVLLAIQREGLDTAEARGLRMAGEQLAKVAGEAPEEGGSRPG